MITEVSALGLAGKGGGWSSSVFAVCILVGKGDESWLPVLADTDMSWFSVVVSDN